MPCTTLLVGKNASYDGSTLMARNEDSGAGSFAPKKFIVVKPEDQPRLYISALSGVKITLPEDPMRYTACPNALPNEGIWGEAGINACNVAMSATETITSNARVLGADPLLPCSIGEEDLLTIVLPYIHSAREGVLRLGALLEEYGTYEMNAIGFQDVNEIWWLETIGGHHWMAKRVPDDACVVMPNQLGIDSLDLRDALGEGRGNLCSRDLWEFIRENHLDLSMQPEEGLPTALDARAAFGSHTDADHCYNTPRAWDMLRRLIPHGAVWSGPRADYGPESDDLPWAVKPEHKLTVEEVKEILSLHYQGTEFDPYGRYGDGGNRGKYRPIGINRNNFVAVTQLRPYLPAGLMALQWIAMGSNVFNGMVPFYANVESTPAYLADTDGKVTTDNFYWVSRLIAAMADPHYGSCIAHIERYRRRMAGLGHRLTAEAERSCLRELPEDLSAYLAEVNEKIAAEAKKETDELLGKVLYESSCHMKNAYSRSDG